MSKPGKKTKNKGHRQFHQPKIDTSKIDIGPVEFEMVDIGFGRKELAIKQMIGGVPITKLSADGLAHRPLSPHEYIVIEVHKREVETLDTNSALERLYVLTDSKEAVLTYREKVQISFSGYDYDPREVIDIPEIRTYFKQLVADWPHWIWFVCRGTGTVGLLFSLLCETAIVPGSLNKITGAYSTHIKDEQELSDVLTDMLMRSSALFETYQIDMDDIDKSTMSALKEIGY